MGCKLAGGVFALTLLMGACMTTAPAPAPRSARPSVSRIDLSRTTGHVGEKFEAHINVESHRLGNTELKVRSLPPGLRFDAKSRAIVGVPKADGFYSVTVAVRKKRGPGIHFNTPGGAWFSERLDIDIFRPVDDLGEREAWEDKGLARAD
jgi:hypothetical protein